MPFTQTEKDKFWLDANLDNNKTAVNSFMDYANEKVDEFFIQQKVKDKCFLLGQITKMNNWMTDLGRILIALINLMLFFSLEINEGETVKNPSLFGMNPQPTKALLMTIGIMILIFFALMTGVQGVIVIGIQYKRTKNANPGFKEKGKISKIFHTIAYIFTHFEETVQLRSIWCLLFCLGFSIAGVSSDLFWFSFTLMYLLIFSPQILEVTNAIWNPKRRIISTVILSAVVLYWFGIVAYVYFGSDFDDAVEGSNITLRRILVVIFDSFYNFGVGGFLSDNGSSAIMRELDNEQFEYHLRGTRIGFDFMFFFVVNTLLLSIVSGIIIDNFGERRSKSDTIHQRQNDLCFICGKLSSDLPDFQNHCKFTHNIWDYMYYIGCLKAMDKKLMTDYRDLHVYRCLEQSKNDWFPAYQDFVIEEAAKKKPTDILGEVIQYHPHQGAKNQADSSLSARDDEEVSSNLFREKIEALEQVVKNQSRVIKKQSQEAKKQNKEMKEKMEEMRAQNKEMKAQNEQIKAQNEQIQAQNEDIKSILKTLTQNLP